MKRIRNKVLRGFFDELRFAPAEQKEKELEGAERLLQMVEAGVEYPLDFVCFRITGYRRRGEDTEELIEGSELAEGLGVFIGETMRQLSLEEGQQGERVFRVEEVAERFGVSVKTIERWRKRGLRGRLFVYGDGKRRLGFLRSDVERFAGRHLELIEAGRRFNRLSAEEKRELSEEAVGLAKEGMMRNRIISELAARSGRGRETIRCLLVEHDKKGGGEGVSFRRSSGRISARDMGAVHKLYSNGVGVEELMERFDRSRSSIYRIINKYRATRLLVRKVGYVESLEFESEEAQGRIPAIADLNERGETKGVVLSREQERVLFRRYNFVKYLACVRLEGLDVERCSSRAVGEIEGWLDESEEIKKVIIEANLGLVASIASKHSRGGVGMSDLVSEGSLSLMRAVEKFDYTRGYRFSTYATWAITKDFARKIPEEARHRERTGGGGDMSNVEEDMRIGEAVDFGAIERAGHSLDEVIRNNLTEREAYIIRNHYALGAGVVRKKPKTLKQIGSDLGLSSERIRQIELEALQKLRQNLSAEEFDLLTG